MLTGANPNQVSRLLLHGSGLSSVQSLSRVQLFVTPMDCSTPGFPVHHQLQNLLKLMSIELVMPSNHLILCRPLLLPPSIFPSIRVFSNESVLHIRWPKYWSFSFSISPSNEYSGLISFMIDWFDLLAVQGILESLLQHHSSKASILRRSAFFIFKISFIYLFIYFFRELKEKGRVKCGFGAATQGCCGVYCTRHTSSTLAEPPEP